MAATGLEGTPSWIAWSTAAFVAEALQGNSLQPTSSTYRRPVWLLSSDAFLRNLLLNHSGHLIVTVVVV